MDIVLIALGIWAIIIIVFVVVASIIINKKIKVKANEIRMEERKLKLKYKIEIGEHNKIIFTVFIALISLIVGNGKEILNPNDINRTITLISILFTAYIILVVLLMVNSYRQAYLKTEDI